MAIDRLIPGVLYYQQRFKEWLFDQQQPTTTRRRAVNISKLNKAAVLAALYNHSRPQGRGFMHFDPKPMTVEEAQKILDSGQIRFDYLKGRVMKVDLSNNILDTLLYDRDNGQGAAEKAILEELTRPE